MTHKAPFSQRIFLLVILLALLLTACELPASPVTRAEVRADTAATQAAFVVQTIIVRASLTPTPSPSPAPSITPTPTIVPTGTPTLDPNSLSSLQVTAQPGLELYLHPDIPDYIFQIDPALWQKDPSGSTSNLFHTSIDNCQILSVPGHGLGAPERQLWEDYGRFRWEIMDYGSWAYVVPVLGSGVTNESSFLQLNGYDQSKCRSAEEGILSDLMTRSEALGAVPMALFQSPTPRPPLDNFSCPDTPDTRLRVGDTVAVITNGLWLRSEPRVDDSTQIRKLLRYVPYLIQITGGPVCEQYVYWQVDVSTFGEGSETIQGWLAEGDLEEYYLMTVK